MSTEQCVSTKANEVLQLLTRKGPPLSPKQLEYCSEACINRILGTRHSIDNVKKAAKQLRETLTWRANFDVDYLTADEFSAELAAGIAYVAGHDEQGKPVLILTLNSEPSTNEAQKKLLKFFAFTLEVAIAAMEAPVEQFVLIFNAGSLRKGSSAISTTFQLLKLLGEHYPKRLARAFMMDAPFMFYYLWKGISSLLDLGINDGLRFVYTRNYTTQAEALAGSHFVRAVKSYSNSNIVWEEQGGDTLSKLNKYTKSNDHFCTTATTTTTSATSPSCNNEASLLSDKSKARSLSFATSWIKPLLTPKEYMKAAEFRSFRVQTDKQRQRGIGEEQQEGSQRWSDLYETKKECDSIHDIHRFGHKNTKKKARDLFKPYYINFVKCKPYNEEAYRAKLKPPLAGLISIISSDLSCIKQQRLKIAPGLYCLEDKATESKMRNAFYL